METAQVQPDTPANAMPGGTRAAISVGASPFVHINNLNQAELVTVSGGTVTSIELSRDGTTFDLVGLLAGLQLLRMGDRLRVTYVLAPTMVAYPL